MIPLYFDKGVAYVWNAEDWYHLRTEHRICGCLIGSLPSFPRQNDFLGLPMALMSEETALLLEKNISELYELLDLTKEPSESQKQEAKALEKRLLEEQKEALKKKKIEQLTQKIDIIVAGKKRKLSSKGVPESEINIDNEVVLQEEINKLPQLAPAHVLVHLPTEHQWHSEKRKLDVDSLIPSVLDSAGKVRYAVYKDLWERGHYITTGMKFGADFLAYPGDPVKFHAMYMVRCIYNKSALIRPRSLVSLGRLSVSVNKLVVLATCNEKEEVNYQTLQWHDSVNI